MVVASEHPRLEESIFNPVVEFAIAGALILLVGLAGFIISVRQMLRVGDGTIMPWDPANKLVTGSLYAYVRNPMILSVIAIVVGEALLFGSLWLAVLALLFYAINMLYFVFSEEPNLERRFGEAYLRYKRNVPRWIPRFTPWKPG
jgi:protein-S-isoprenylcysteine O-methyltransferase Ste14